MSSLLCRAPLLCGGWFWCVCLFVSPALAQPAAVTKARQAEFPCHYASGPVRIDGMADDAAWKQAPVIDDFVNGWNKGGPRPGRTQTKARILWDDQNFYFLAEMEDHDLYADITEHDGATWLNDVFEVFLKPADDQPAYYEFEVSARNTVFDLYLPAREKGNFDKFLKANPFHLQTAVTRRGTLDRWQDRDEGWTVEGLIPWSDLALTGGAPRGNDRWKFALCRYDYSLDFKSPDLTSNAYFTIANYHQHEEYPRVRFLPATVK